MRVLFLTGEFPPMQGGVGDCTNEIAQALAQRGVQVSVLTTDDSASDVRPPPSVTLPSSSVKILRLVKKWDWSALALIRETVENTNAEIVHIQYQTGAFGMHPMINFAPRLLHLAPFTPARGDKVRTALKSVVTFHDLRPMYLFPKAGPVRDWVTFQLAGGCDAVIATNQEDYARLVPYHAAHLACIPIGSNIDPTPPPNFSRAALRAQLGIAPDEMLLCYFGFLNDSKGGETLVRALAELTKAKLIMLGGTTGASDSTNVPYLTHVKKLIHELGLEARVIWTDFLPQPEVSVRFLASDICVLPYRDGASYRRGTLMAALAHGMAIVTTKDGGQTTEDGQRAKNGSTLPALRDGENVLLVPPDDPHAIAIAVQRIAASPELRSRLQQGARTTAEFFTWDKIADAHLELYERLLG